MCGRFTLTERDTPALSERFGIRRSGWQPAFKPSYNVAPTHNVAVVTNEGERQIEFQRWGLIPFWAKDMKSGSKMINARSETLQSSGAFKHAFKRRRCLILADGFYEWKKEDGLKIPMRIGLKNWELFAFAGLWESWTNKETNEEVRSCTVITCQPNDLMAPIHNRMPVILPEIAEAAWLDGEQELGGLQSLLVPFSADSMNAYAVGSIVNSVKNNEPDCIVAA